MEKGGGYLQMTVSDLRRATFHEGGPRRIETMTEQRGVEMADDDARQSRIETKRSYIENEFGVEFSRRAPFLALRLSWEELLSLTFALEAAYQHRQEVAGDL